MIMWSIAFILWYVVKVPYFFLGDMIPLVLDHGILLSLKWLTESFCDVTLMYCSTRVLYLLCDFALINALEDIVDFYALLLYRK